MPEEKKVRGKKKKSYGERIEKLGDLGKRMEKALREENVVTLVTLNILGVDLNDNGESDEAIKFLERCLAGQTKVLGEDTLRSLGAVYCDGLKNYEKTLEYMERALNGNERMLGENHPSTLIVVESTGTCYANSKKDFGKAEEFFQKALEGYEAQFGKEHHETIPCATNYISCLNNSDTNPERLEALETSYPWLLEQSIK